MLAVKARPPPRLSCTINPDIVLRSAALDILATPGELNLIDAVDALQAAAVASGLVDAIGQDEVQAILAAAFSPTVENPEVKAADNITGFAAAAWEHPGWAAAARDYAEHRPPLPKANDNVRIFPQSTLDAVDYLARQNDPARLRAWLARHTAEEREAIQKHLGRRAHAAKPRSD